VIPGNPEAIGEEVGDVKRYRILQVEAGQDDDQAY
jgi:hypothetical protein